MSRSTNKNSGSTITIKSMNTGYYNVPRLMPLKGADIDGKDVILFNDTFKLNAINRETLEFEEREFFSVLIKSYSIFDVNDRPKFFYLHSTSEYLIRGFLYGTRIFHKYQKATHNNPAKYGPNLDIPKIRIIGVIENEEIFGSNLFLYSFREFFLMDIDKFKAFLKEKDFNEDESATRILGIDLEDLIKIGIIITQKSPDMTKEIKFCHLYKDKIYCRKNRSLLEIKAPFGKPKKIMDNLIEPDSWAVDGKYIACRSHIIDGEVEVINLDTLEKSVPPRVEEGCSGLALKDGYLIIFYWSGLVSVWKLDGWELIYSEKIDFREQDSANENLTKLNKSANAQSSNSLKEEKVIDKKGVVDGYGFRDLFWVDCEEADRTKKSKIKRFLYGLCYGNYSNTFIVRMDFSKIF